MKNKRSLQSQVQRYEFLCTWLIYFMAEALSLGTFLPSLMCNSNTHLITTKFDISNFVKNQPKLVVHTQVPNNTQYCLIHKSYDNSMCPITSDNSVVDAIRQLGNWILFFSLTGVGGSDTGPAILTGSISNGYVDLYLTIKTSICYLDPASSTVRACSIICITS